ncbi:hypothetical protein HJFPF1_11275 [Paramyrothecium foliicola]|nr:hypothetical protein HJFPF1_11275 [Paramyrothecium foliicola]
MTLECPTTTTTTTNPYSPLSHTKKNQKEKERGYRTVEGNSTHNTRKFSEAQALLLLHSRGTMSSTMVVTMAAPTLSTALSCCPSCGLSSTDQTQADLLRAQARIADLETQVRLLNQKATAAVDRWADYEDELGKLRSQVNAAPPPPPPPKELSPPPEVSPTRTSFLQAGTNRLSQLLYPRKPTPSLRTPTAEAPPVPAAASRPSHTRNTSSGGAPPPLSPAPSATPTNEDLLEALTREQSLRKEAEGRLTDSSLEIEELSAALFEQANEMVADERRARAKLEERVGELERRDAEKRRRLEKLETAMTRIERVRTLLREGDGSDPPERAGGNLTRHKTG